MSPTDDALMGIANAAEELAAEVAMLKKDHVEACGISEKTQRMNGAVYALRRAASAIRGVTMVAGNYPALEKSEDPS